MLYHWDNIFISKAKENIEVLKEKRNMTHSEWLEEGDVVLSEGSMKYFNDLIDFIKDKGLKDSFKEWVQKRSEVCRQRLVSLK